MNSSATSVALSTRSRPATPTQDEEMVVTVQMQEVVVETSPYIEDLKCDFIDDTFFTKTGIIMQFINGNCPGSPSTIGGMRLALTDVRKLPAYISRNRGSIKVHALRYLNKHLKEMQCSIGATECLKAEDYGMTFSMASVSNNGALLNPARRNEGPMFYCLLSGLVSPVLVQIADWDDQYTRDDTVHMVNCYIHLLPASQRRNAVVARHNEEVMAKANNTVTQAKQQEVRAAKKQKLTYAPSAPRYAPQEKTFDRNNNLKKDMQALRQEVVQLRLTATPNPPLPTTKAVIWPPANGCPDMPDE